MESHQQGLRSLQKKRTTNFREDETKLLIQLWGSPQIQNKLYLTHRKEPVMRLLAANMQQRGFYRTPDEIKTRIRNLKCLYHRIKRTVQSGSGIGTVDPDWPHYKAMDDILSKQSQKKENLYKDNVFEGPRCEDIKQEIDDIDINDDMESYTTNSMAGSEFEEEHMAMPPLTPAPRETIKKEPKTYQTAKSFQKILPNVTIPMQQATSLGQNSKQQQQQQQQQQIPSLPFPLLILNGVQPSPGANSSEKNRDPKSPLSPSSSANDFGHLLKELLDVQRENLDIDRQRLELEKQRLEFERFVGSQLLSLGPVLGTLFSRFAPGYSDGGDSAGGDEKIVKGGSKRASSCDIDSIFKESKILKTLLSEGIKKYMMGEEEENDDSENEDSGIHNDENSNSSTK